VKCLERDLFLGWGQRRNDVMVELRGPGGAGEQERRSRLNRWRRTAPKSSHGIRELESFVEAVFEADRLHEAACDLPGIRQDVVDRVRAEIAAGSYETPAKINALAERLLDVLGGRPGHA
jgi:hypothetical protein